MATMRFELIGTVRVIASLDGVSEEIDLATAASLRLTLEADESVAEAFRDGHLVVGPDEEMVAVMAHPVRQIRVTMPMSVLERLVVERIVTEISAGAA